MWYPKDYNKIFSIVIILKLMERSDSTIRQSSFVIPQDRPILKTNTVMSARSLMMMAEALFPAALSLFAVVWVVFFLRVLGVKRLSYKAV